MSEQGLREALQRLADQDGPIDPSEIRGLLFDRPNEPAAVVTDEAVQDLHAGVVTQFRRHGQYTLADARAALEAAAPLLGPRPLLDREAAVRVISGASNPAESDTILGREYVGNWADVFADAVMELARPMPTREELAAAGHRWSCLKRDESVHELDAIDYDRADEILEIWALLNGAES